jgi:hypothetical protein
MSVEALCGAMGVALGQPEPRRWQDAYPPDRVAELAEELTELEGELDDGWPTWRRATPFAHLSPEKKRWVRLRLRRRDLIVRGLADTYGIYAPPTGGPCALVRQRGTYSLHYDQPISLSLFATRRGLPLAAVEKAAHELRRERLQVTRRRLAELAAR